MKILLSIAISLLFGSTLASGQQPKKAGSVLEGSRSAMDIVTHSRSRLLVFHAERPTADPKIVIYTSIPKAGEISKFPVLIHKFAKYTTSKVQEDFDSMHEDKVLKERSQGSQPTKPNLRNSNDRVRQNKIDKSKINDDELEY